MFKNKKPNLDENSRKPSPGIPGEVILLGSAASTFVKSPACCQFKDARNHIQATADHWETKELQATDNRTTSPGSPLEPQCGTVKHHNSSQLFTVLSVSTLCTSLFSALTTTHMRLVLLVSFYKWGHWDSKRRSNMPQVTRLVSWNCVSVTPNPRTQMILISPLSFTCCVALGKCLSFPESKFLLPCIRLLHSVFSMASSRSNFLWPLAKTPKYEGRMSPGIPAWPVQLQRICPWH